MKKFLGVILFILSLIFIVPLFVGMYSYIFGFRFFDNLEGLMAFLCCMIGVGFGAIAVWLFKE